MKSAAISKLKATLSEYIAYVKAGEEVLVTERGKAVAVIVPAGKGHNVDTKRMELARRGILRPGKGRISSDAFQDLPLVSVPDKSIERALDEDREETT